VIVEYDAEAFAAIQAVFDDTWQSLLADRLEQVLDALEAGPPFPALVRARRMQEPKLWYVRLIGRNGESFALLWDLIADDRVKIHWAGPEI
jgi:hypothetical protein